MKKNLILCTCLFAVTHLFGQSYYAIDFTGTVVNPQTVNVENLTQSTNITLPGEDTLHLLYTTVNIREDIKDNTSLIVYPNPMDYSCHFEFLNTEKGKVVIRLFGMDGRIVHSYESELTLGIHTFQLSGVPSGMYALSVTTQSNNIAARFISKGHTDKAVQLKHIGEAQESSIGSFKAKSEKAIYNMSFQIGDQLRFVGIAAGYDNDTVLLSPISNQTIDFKFSPISFQCGVSSVTFSYNGSQVTYGTVTGANGRCWLDRNLGASQVATSSTDYLAYGDLFQWGRPADGHQLIHWTNSSSGTPVHPTTSGNCDAVNTDTPPHTNFIKCSTSPNDWRSPQNANLWQGVSGTNNPCPPGWRLATEAEWDIEAASWTPQNAAGAFNSPLKLTATGFRHPSTGDLTSVGAAGGYWSSTTSGIHTRTQAFVSTIILTVSDHRAHARPCRCIKD